MQILEPANFSFKLQVFSILLFLRRLIILSSQPLTSTSLLTQNCKKGNIKDELHKRSNLDIKVNGLAFFFSQENLPKNSHLEIFPQMKI